MSIFCGDRRRKITNKKGFGISKLAEAPTTYFYKYLQANVKICSQVMLSIKNNYLIITLYFGFNSTDF